MLGELTDSLKLYESNAIDFSGLLDEISEVEPDMILLEESSPFLEDSFLVLLLVNKPGLPVIVINEDTNVMHVVHRETTLLTTSNDLVETINLL